MLSHTRNPNCQAEWPFAYFGEWAFLMPAPSEQDYVVPVTQKPPLPFGALPGNNDLTVWGCGRNEDCDLFQQATNGYAAEWKNMMTSGPYIKDEDEQTPLRWRGCVDRLPAHSAP